MMQKKAVSKMAPRKKETPRVFESNTLAVQSLRLIAAPDPKDDLTDAELEQLCKDPRQSAELIHYLIDFVKKM
ncbi:MAG: hypothetical protein MUC85_03105 [Anaerolineales bacterium]|jgi:hypothetical protein|nr:hypothetical protein [Anaerolineales bacterium]